MKTAVVQMRVGDDKRANMARAAAFVKQAAEQGAEVVVLPEMFNCPYQTKNFPVYAEKAGGECWTILANAARENAVYLIGGSMPEDEVHDALQKSWVTGQMVLTLGGIS